MPEKKDPEIVALEAVYAALKSLDSDGRQKVLASVFALLDIPAASSAPQPALVVEPAELHRERKSPGRPLSLVELIQEKSPGTNVQRIALFAYYRDKYQGKPRFARTDLKEYFSMAKEQPPGNFDRDFVEAAKQGWIHEDESDSYITSKGIEAVEAAFPGQRSYSKSSRTTRRGSSKGIKATKRRRRKTSRSR